MRLHGLILTFMAAAIVPALYAAPAQAQATRTWVSGVGDDVNPCSRTAPCKTFAGAISKTAAGGEINCLDPGGFGGVTITKAMTITCQYTEGGALAGGNGVVVNAPADAVVMLRGLDIFGVNPPTNGVRFIAGAALIIMDSTIRRFNAATSNGISFAPSGVSELVVINTLVADNSNGIFVLPTATGSAKVVLNGVNMVNNSGFGLRADATSGAVNTVVQNSSATGNTNAGLLAVAPTAGRPSFMMVKNSVVSGNGIGLRADGAAAAVQVGDSVVTANGTGANAAASGVVSSYGDNQISGNNVDGTPLPVAPPG